MSFTRRLTVRDFLYAERVNCTQLNRQFIIRYRRKGPGGNYEKTRGLITARQLCEIIGDEEKLVRMISRLEKNTGDKFVAKFRKIGAFEFCWR